MKLFQQLMLAHAALGLVAPMSAMAGELNFAAFLNTPPLMSKSPASASSLTSTPRTGPTRLWPT